MDKPMNRILLVLLPLTLSSAISSCSQTSPPKTTETEYQSKTYPTPGQVFLKAKLLELDNIRNTPEFEKYRFSKASPYSQWSQKLITEMNLKTDFSAYEKSGIAMLSNLSLEYVFGDRTGIKASRKQIEEIINTDQSPTRVIKAKNTPQSCEEKVLRKEPQRNDTVILKNSNPISKDVQVSNNPKSWMKSNEIAYVANCTPAKILDIYDESYRAGDVNIRTLRYKIVTQSEQKVEGWVHSSNAGFNPNKN
jgi:hypothetical protein